MLGFQGAYRSNEMSDSVRAQSHGTCLPGENPISGFGWEYHRGGREIDPSGAKPRGAVSIGLVL